MTRMTLAKVLATMAAMSMCLADDCADGSCENDDVALLALPQKKALIAKRMAIKRSVARDPAGDLYNAITLKAPMMDDTSFKLLVGDGDGIKFAYETAEPHCDDGFSTHKCDFTTPIRVASSGKWIVSSALGAAVQAGKFAWDDPISKYIDFWTSDASDARSKVTFRNLMDMTSGIVADSYFGKPSVAHHVWGELDDEVDTADLGWGNSDLNLEDVARNIFDNTRPDVCVGNCQFRYGETHFLLAEYAAIKATGLPNWQSFMETYWGNKLGLNRQNSRMSFQGDALSYGFTDDLPHIVNSSIGDNELIPNPDGGSQLVTTACSTARWLTEMVKNPDTYGSAELDAVPPGQLPSFSNGAQYALGHWYQPIEGEMDMTPPGPSVHHSEGAFGAFPMKALDDNGKPFWAYLHRQWKKAPGATVYSRVFSAMILPDLRTFMASAPPVNSTMVNSVCVN